MPRCSVLLALLASLALLIEAQPTVAHAEHGGAKRAETRNYTGPSPAAATEGAYASACTSTSPIDFVCARFDLKPTDRFISLSITDLSGRPIYAIAWDDSDQEIVEFCGETARPVPSPGGDFFYVEVIAANSRLGCYPSTVTQGTITATFTRRRR